MITIVGEVKWYVRLDRFDACKLYYDVSGGLATVGVQTIWVYYHFVCCCGNPIALGPNIVLGSKSRIC
jgi:hypothetical protein